MEFRKVLNGIFLASHSFLTRYIDFVRSYAIHFIKDTMARMS